MPAETTFSNALVVTPSTIVRGCLCLRDGIIVALDDGAVWAGEVVDLEGDYLIPGLIELHTDNLEKHYSPRPGAEWDAVTAAMSHDVQLAGCGITTVYDSLVLGAAPGWDMRDSWLKPMLDGLAKARERDMLKIEHRLHLRCEVTHRQISQLLESFLDEPGLGFLSLMDHAPGDRQSPDLEVYKRRYMSTTSLVEAEVDAHIAHLLEGSRVHGPGNRQRIATIARERGIPVASHDDAREEHIVEAAGLGCVLTEFPTTLDAAQSARDHDLQVLMGSPNLIRGGSHSGNVAAATLAEAGALDILSSDYIPASLLLAAFRLTQDERFEIALPAAIATVTANPARAAGLEDRGRIAPGLRADVVRVRVIEGRPVVRGVWVQGQRVA